MSCYVIAGGREGKERLNLLARVMQPTTSQLFETVGVYEPMKCLDVGCGGGHVTLLMASLVGPKGKAVGIDFDPRILALAQEDAEAEGLENVEFRCADAGECQDEGGFDLVYARFVLTHLAKPEMCLESMLRACRPNGLIVIEDIDFTGSFCHPPCAAYDSYTRLYQNVVNRKGGDPNIGPKLPGMLRRLGVVDVHVNIVQPTHFEGEGKTIAAITMQRISDSVIAEGLATKPEIMHVIDGLNAAASDPNILMGAPRIFQTWGRKG